MIVEVRHLETLAAISETGSFTRAARRVHLTLSAVSHQVRELETLLGATLVDRRSKPVRLTAAGQRLVACAESVLPAIRAAEADIARLSSSGARRLYLAPECHSCFEWLLPTLDALRDAWPDLDVDLRLGPRFNPIPALVSSEVDAVLGTDRVEHPAIAYDALFRYEIVLVVPRQHRLARRVRIEPKDMAGEVLVTYPVEPERLDIVTRFLRPAGIEPVPGRTAELTSVLLQLVRSRKGVVALPRWAVSDSLSRGDLVALTLGDGLWSELFLATRKADHEEPHIQSFLEISRRVSRELLVAIEAA